MLVEECLVDAIIVLAGFAVGLLVGMTGVGGGSLMTPLLVLVYQVPVLVAVGTDLLFATLTKSVGVWAHTRLGTVEWRIVLLLAAGSLPAAVSTITVLDQLQHHAHLEQTLRVLIGAALLLTAMSLLQKALFGANSGESAWDGTLSTMRSMLTVLLGAMLGVSVSVTSVGAGALGLVALGWLYPRLAIKRLVGTDIAHAVPLTAIGGIGHWQLGNVDTALLGVLLLGSLPGIYIGSRVAANLPDRVTRPLLATLLGLVGVKFIS